MSVSMFFFLRQHSCFLEYLSFIFLIPNKRYPNSNRTIYLSSKSYEAKRVTTCTHLLLQYANEVLGIKLSFCYGRGYLRRLNCYDKRLGRFFIKLDESISDRPEDEDASKKCSKISRQENG